MDESDDIGGLVALFLLVVIPVALYRLWLAFLRASREGRIHPTRWATGPKTLACATVAAVMGLATNAAFLAVLVDKSGSPTTEHRSLRLFVVNSEGTKKVRVFEPGDTLQFGFSLERGVRPSGAVVELPLPEAFEAVSCDTDVDLDLDRRVVRYTDDAFRPLTHTCSARISPTTRRGVVVDVTGTATIGTDVVIGWDELRPDVGGHVRLGVGVAPPGADEPILPKGVWMVLAYAGGGLLSFLSVVLSRRVRRAGGGVFANVVTVIGVVGCVLGLIPVTLLAMLYLFLALWFSRFGTPTLF